MRLIQLFVSSFIVSSCFCTPQKELPAVAFLQQQKLAVNDKSFSLQSGAWCERVQECI
jgi:hypothetical protein